MPFDSTMCLATSDLTLICIIIVYNYHFYRHTRSPRSAPHGIVLSGARYFKQWPRQPRVFGLDFLRI